MAGCSRIIVVVVLGVRTCLARRDGAAGVRRDLRHRPRPPSAGLAGMSDHASRPSARGRQRTWAIAAICTARPRARPTPTCCTCASPGFPGIDFYFKDEAAHPTGSLKHRLARSLFLYALCNGRLREGQAVVDASSGSTAISEAWFARLLGLPFIAVMPACTAPAKIEAVLALGGRCELTEAGICTQARAREIADEGACFLDQFGLAERATDWRGNNNIAESIIEQLAREPHPQPAWIVCGVGTGGTSATIGRYLRYRGLDHAAVRGRTQGSGFVQGWRERDPAHASRPP
jgi:cysteine synthase A